MDKNKKNSKKNNYPKKAYSILAEIEENHFWFQGRNLIIQTFLKKNFKKMENKSFLEIGCGTGYVLRMLDGLFKGVVGLDTNIEGLKIAQSRINVKLFCTTLEKFKYAGKFDALGMFDVLEHIDDQKNFLKKAKPFLKKNGLIFLTVPANMKLWTEIDEISGHMRRYDLKMMKNVLEDSGYKVEEMKYFNFFLLIPQLIMRSIVTKKNKKHKSNSMEVLNESLKPPPRFFNQMFKLLFILESKIMKYWTLPVGASIIVMAKKVR